MFLPPKYSVSSREVQYSFPRGTIHFPRSTSAFPPKYNGIISNENGFVESILKLSASIVFALFITV